MPDITVYIYIGFILIQMSIWCTNSTLHNDGKKSGNENSSRTFKIGDKGLPNNPSDSKVNKSLCNENKGSNKTCLDAKNVLLEELDSDNALFSANGSDFNETIDNSGGLRTGMLISSPVAGGAKPTKEPSLNFQSFNKSSVDTETIKPTAEFISKIRGGSLSTRNRSFTLSLDGDISFKTHKENYTRSSTQYLPLPSTTYSQPNSIGGYPVETSHLQEPGYELDALERNVSLLFSSSSFSDEAQESRSSLLGRRVSSLLDSLLLGYDKRLRPDFGRSPLTVKADIEIRSMGPISEKDMIFSMDCYFRQNWVDRRLAFNATEEQVTNVSLNLKMLERIWHPDTYFINGGPSYVHTITTPNKFVRLFFDGSILYSQRLTIKANCPMHLEKFPMDSQLCPLYIASFGYPASDVIYEWHYGNALAAVASNDMRLSQFDLKGMPATNTTKSFKGSPHSILTILFDFRRHTGFFLIQVYLPCCLLVILSWVSFWINREATSDRISLGATTMLTMTFLVLDSRNDLPRVAYSTALDVYVALCFFFVFASIVQFAAVHFFTKYGTADSDFRASIMPDTESDTDGEDSSVGRFTSGRQNNFRQPVSSHMNLKPDSLTACIRKMWSCLLSTRARRFNKNVRNSLGLNSVSKIDTVSRVVFPLAFFGLNIVYWISYW